MRRLIPKLFLAIAYGFSLPSAAMAASCLRGHQPFKLAADTVSWTMTIAPGANCIQGLRWSTMQIASVTVATAPKHGTVVVVGPGFRYYATQALQDGRDHFTLVVTGQNRHDLGSSTVEISVGPLVQNMANSQTE